MQVETDWEGREGNFKVTVTFYILKSRLELEVSIIKGLPLWLQG